MHGTRERGTPALLAEELWTVITLSSRNTLQYYIFEYTFFSFGMKRGRFGGAAEAFGGALPMPRTGPGRSPSLCSRQWGLDVCAVSPVLGIDAPA